METPKHKAVPESIAGGRDTQLSPHCRYLYHNRFTAGPDYVITSHEHLFWHVEFVRRGVLETVVGAKAYTILPGSALMLPPQVSHSFVYREPDTTVFSVKYELHNLPLPPQAIAVEQSTVLDAFVAALDELLATTRSPDDTRIAAVEHVLAAFVHVSVQSPQTAGEPSRLTLVDRIRAAIENAEGRNLTVAGLARDLGFSQTYLRTQFRRQEGVSLKEFIDRHRGQRGG